MNVATQIQRRSITAQIAEVRREIEQREKVYHGLVARRKMGKGEAEERLNLMRNVLVTLERIDRHKETINAAIAAQETGHAHT